MGSSLEHRKMVARRREQVAELTRQGWSAKQIQAALGCTEDSVRNDRRVTGTTRLGHYQMAAEERCQRVVEMTRAGMSSSLIAEILKTTPRTVIRDRKKAGIAKPPPRHLTEEEIATVERLLDDGASLSEASRSIGRRDTALHNTRRFRGRGWTPQEIGEFAAACHRLGHCG